MPINPLPQFEADLLEYEEDRKAYAELTAPKTLVVRFGAMHQVGEFPYSSSVKPGCGTKVVVRTYRGVELAEMLTSTCANAGCGKSVTRKEMLEYINNSGGKDYPFYSNGKVLRVATGEDLDKQDQLEQSRHGLKMDARERSERLGLDMRVVDAEPILGGERLTIYYSAEERVDFRDLMQELGTEHRTRIEMKQVGARDEARIVADYEKCGQYCCCKNFLKVLKPVSMRSAKVQKATLDPLKISGRCGRLMCCLRYEDQTYTELKKKLPRRKLRVGTPHGDGIVIDSQILTQLVLVSLDTDDSRVAVPVEDLTEPGIRATPKQPAPAQEEKPEKSDTRKGRRSGGGRSGSDKRTQPRAEKTGAQEKAGGESSSKKRRRRRKRKSQDGAPAQESQRAEPGKPTAQGPRVDSSGADSAPDGAGETAPHGAKSKKRRRRRRRKGSGDKNNPGS